MTGPEGALARPDEQAVAEAKRWFRDPARPDRIDWIENPPGEVIGWAQKHAATIVRAALAAGPDILAGYTGEDSDPELTADMAQAVAAEWDAVDARDTARPAAEPDHDNRCEAEYIHEAPGWTECGCARRAATTRTETPWEAQR